MQRIKKQNHKLQNKKKFVFSKNKTKWIFLLLTLMTLQFFAFFKIIILSSLHLYTFGLFFGYFYFLFYFFWIFIALYKIFPHWFKINFLQNQKNKIKYFYFIFVFFILLLGSFFAYDKNWNWNFNDVKWNITFQEWFKKFTVSNNAWLPSNNHPGIISTFLYLLFVNLFSKLGFMVFFAIIFFIFIFYIIKNWKKINLKKELNQNQNHQEDDFDKNLKVFDYVSKNELFSKTNIDSENSEKINIKNTNIDSDKSNIQKTNIDLEKSNNNIVIKTNDDLNNEKNNKKEEEANSLPFIDPFDI